jgi:GNAT superfamily N-acetyltransferase
VHREAVIHIADESELAIVAQLARQIWPVAYGNILSADQIAYMLQLIYSEAALRRQLQEEKQQFIIARLDGEPVGYASWSLIEEPGVYKLHKLYVVPSCQGKGIGIQMVRYILDQLPPGATALRLHVNRYNSARYFYEKCGFTIIAQADIPIGEGYFMNDYVMERKIGPTASKHTPG